MRIQILPLPTVVVGDMVDQQFALVVDQCQYNILNPTPSSVAKAAMERLERFGEECFALAVLVTDETVEIVDRHAELEKPKTDLQVTRISLPEDFDAVKVQQEFRFMLGLCRDCGKSPCVCLRSAPCPDWSHEIEHDAHEWDAPVDGHVHCPGWPPVADGDEGQG